MENNLLVMVRGKDRNRVSAITFVEERDLIKKPGF